MQICHYLTIVNLVLTSWVSVENNYSNYIDSGGPHLVFNGHSYVQGSSSPFALQLPEFIFLPSKKWNFQEVPSWNLVSAVWKKVVPECVVSGQAGLTLLQHLKNVGLA